MSAPAASAREERLQRITAILAALPPLPDRADSVQECAERLLIHAEMMLVNDTPRANVGTTKQAIAELDEFGKLSARLIEHVYRMHGIALAALKTPKRRVILPSSAVGNPEMSEIGRHPFVVASDLRVLALAAAVKIKELKSAPPSKKPRTALRRSEAAETARRGCD